DEVLKELRLPDKIIVHTAASVPKEILKDFSKHYGVIYPLQSLKKEIPDLPDIPILIDANDSETMAQLETVAHSISSNVAKAGDDERMKLHIAAVFCNNFVNHLYFLAEEYCKGEGIDFELLKLLIIETAERLNQANPSDSQTG